MHSSFKDSTPFFLMPESKTNFKFPRKKKSIVSNLSSYKSNWISANLARVRSIYAVHTKVNMELPNVLFPRFPISMLFDGVV